MSRRNLHLNKAIISIHGNTQKSLIFILLNPSYSLLNLFDAKIRVLNKSCHPLYCRAHGHAVNGSFFLPSKPLQHTGDDEVSTLARLTFYKNLLIGQETSVHCLHLWVSVLSGLNLEKMYGLCQGTRKTVLKNRVSILSGCPQCRCT